MTEPDLCAVCVRSPWPALSVAADMLAGTRSILFYHILIVDQPVFFQAHHLSLPREGPQWLFHPLEEPQNELPQNSPKVKHECDHSEQHRDLYLLCSLL